VPDSDYSRKHALECMRLASDCKQMVGYVSSPALHSHFLQMAKVWSDARFEDRSARRRPELAIICFLKAWGQGNFRSRHLRLSPSRPRIFHLLCRPFVSP